MREYDTGNGSNITGRRILSHVFDTLGEMLDACDMPDHAAQRDAQKRSSLERKAREGDDWTYGELKDGATYTATLRDGWSDAVPRIDALSAKIAGNMATPLDLRRKIRKGPTGDDFDIHASRAGKFDRAWTARRKTVARAPAPIRILCGVVFNAGVNGPAFFWKGACALALAQALRRKGYRVSISGVGCLIGCFTDGNASYVARFDALRYGEAIDTARLASILCTPATLRHVLFRTALLLPRQVGWGYGRAPEDDDMERYVVGSGVFPARNEERLTIPTHVSNERGAAEWLREVSGRFS